MMCMEKEISFYVSFKVAPYSFMTARADDASCSNLHALTRDRKFFLIFYDVSIAKKAKLTVNFLAFPSVIFFLILHILRY